jgi:glucose/arabinose dehydrogenase
MVALTITTTPLAQHAPSSPQPKPVEGVLKATPIVRDLEHPWAMTFLPDGRMLVTERPGRMRIIEPNGKMSEPLAGVPRVHARGQGGLLDVIVDPKFGENRTIYFSYAEPGEGGTNGTAVAKAQLGEGRLENVQVIFRQTPKVQSNGHFGSRLVFARDGTLFIFLGERMLDQHRVHAQDLDYGFGKVMRINSDGSVPKDNPFVGRKGAQPEIWSYGHRNIQAAAMDPRTGKLWEIEHGPLGGDELNQPQPGKNYGWPVITYGREYSGRKINNGLTAKEGMEQPIYYWDPVIAPSGMIFYTGDKFPEWKNNIFVGSLQPGALVRLVLENDRVTKEERYLREAGRVREVEQGPDGLLYLLTDEPDGQLLRVERAGSAAKQ